MPFRAKTQQDPYAAGFRDGILGVLRGGRYRTAPVRVSKSVGSPASDARARYRDVVVFKHDVDHGERVVLRQH